jgi:hypothetical protein
MNQTRTILLHTYTHNSCIRTVYRHKHGTPIMTIVTRQTSPGQQEDPQRHTITTTIVTLSHHPPQHGCTSKRHPHFASTRKHALWLDSPALTLPRKTRVDFESGGRFNKLARMHGVVCRSLKGDRPKRQGAKGEKGRGKNHGSLFWMKPGLCFPLGTTPVADVQPCWPVVLGRLFQDFADVGGLDSNPTVPLGRHSTAQSQPSLQRL